MRETVESPRRAPRRKQLATTPTAEDPALRGRAYHVRFGSVWSAALATAGALRGWHLISWDPMRGEMRAEVTSFLVKRPDEISVHVTLDEVGLTRVDLIVTPRGRRLTRGLARRRIARFLRALDRTLGR